MLYKWRRVGNFAAREPKRLHTRKAEALARDKNSTAGDGMMKPSMCILCANGCRSGQITLQVYSCCKVRVTCKYLKVYITLVCEQRSHLPIIQS